ncbi:uncharacterized protein (TIGR02186 family) [Altererythrobacter atlanticus]|uniref:Transmembrane protein n=1 Tax=Croceibacterium atlanticum TaxID=1267766 RepID=A0A0F7KTC6_9SPHN|nr:TIGR02186 family protein [Croceibacterium atlanticum]AKH42482.1 Putative transmembrane protein [Croceibacterium atlanticum]MBB5731259.1 uncharacterized protein (TIGR02186 family) [Croceibacterium atlanticum]
MTGVRIRIALAITAFLALTAQRDPILVPEVSQHEIQVRQGFTGTELLLFGAILDPDGSRASADYDIVVVLKGPTEAVRLREKERLKWAGIWVNADSSSFRSVPSFYAVASSSPIKNIVDDRTAAIYELGLDFLQLSPTGPINPAEQARFAAGLVDLRQREGLYQQVPGGVTIRDKVLYQARIAIPSNVRTGQYTAETFAITQGRVIASATAEVEVKKLGFERLVAEQAEESSVLYGLFAVMLSLVMGWGAGRLFALV